MVKFEYNDNALDDMSDQDFEADDDIKDEIGLA